MPSTQVAELLRVGRHMLRLAEVSLRLLPSTGKLTRGIF